MDRVELGMNIRRFREQKRLSQEKLAEHLGVSTVFIASIEQGKKAPSLPNIIKIANILSVSSDDLLGYQIEKTYIIKASKLSEAISELPLKEQKKIFNVIDVMIQDYNGEKL